MVDRMVAKRSSEAASDISSTIARRIREEIVRLADEQLKEVNQEFNRLVLDRATRMHLQPSEWNVTGSSDYLTLRLTVDQQSGLGAPAEFSPDSDFDAPAISLHESFINDLANAAFRGQNLPTELDANALQSLNDQLPFKLFEERDFLPETSVHVVLNARQPLHLRIADNRVEMQLRANRIELNDEKLENCRLSIVFRLKPNGDSITVQRIGEPRLLATGDTKVDDDAVRKFEQAVRNELLGAMLPTVEIPSVVENDGWTVRPEKFEAIRGWFTIVGHFSKPVEEETTPEDAPQQETAESVATN